MSDLPIHTNKALPRLRSYRRRRVIWGTVILVIVGLIFLAPPSFWEHSTTTTLRDFGEHLVPSVLRPPAQDKYEDHSAHSAHPHPLHSTTTPAVVKSTKGKAIAKKTELSRFLHMVASSELRISHDVDTSKPLDATVYSADVGSTWFKPLEADPPVIVFSKTYCPYSKKAKALLESYQLSPPPKIVEVDLREDADQVKAILTRLTSHSTFPNIFIAGVSIGGSDDLQHLHENGTLGSKLSDAGVDFQANTKVKK